MLVFAGEQGSCKSVSARATRNLIDPNTAALRSLPRDERDLMIAATNGWVIAFDNVSSLPGWLSDAVCRLATGGGFGTRENYTDRDEVLFEAQRPVIMGGIEDFVTRGDLRDRAIVLTLEPPSDETRLEEDELWPAFERTRPRILGALLDSLSVALREREGTRLSTKPRMADFVRWAVAAAPALGFPAEAFLDAYSDNRRAGHEAMLEDSLIAGPIVAVAKRPGAWEGTAADLLREMEKDMSEEARKRRGWPKNARALSGAIRRLAPSLRASGVQLEHPKRRLIRLTVRTKPESGSVCDGTDTDATRPDAGDANEGDSAPSSNWPVAGDGGDGDSPDPEEEIDPWAA